MKPHQAAVAASLHSGTDGAATASVASQTHTVFDRNSRIRPVPKPPTLVPDRASGRTHTLILTGELDRGSAHALEAAIERLCEEGVAGITLDLRELTYIDSTGVAVIAFRCGLCQRRGYEFSLIPGSRFIQRAFHQAGVADLLPFQIDDPDSEDPDVARLPALVLSHRSRDECDQ